MTKTTRRAAKPAARELPADAPAKLMRAALEVIGEHGFGEASVKAIAQRAGVNHGLIHYHFGGKDELIFEALRLAYEGSLAAIAQLRASMSPNAYWAAAWKLLRHQVRVEPWRYRLTAQITALSVLPTYTLSARVRDVMAVWNAEFANLLVARHGRSAGRRDLALTRALNGAVTATALWVLRDPKADADAELDEIETMFAQAFAQKKGG